MKLDTKTTPVHRSQSGFAALIVVTVVSAVVLAAAMTASLLGIQEADNTLGFNRGIAVRTLAHSCSEESLLRLKLDHSYTGGTLNFEAGSCTVSISGTGMNKTVLITANLDTNPAYVQALSLSVVTTGKSINLMQYQYQ